MPQGVKRGRGGTRGNLKHRIANGGLVETVIDFFATGRDTENNAAKVSRGFHGRGTRGVTRIVEELKYAENLAELGDLREIEVSDVDLRYQQGYVVKIGFAKKGKDVVKLCCTTDRQQLLLVGGDQKIEYGKVVDQLEFPRQKGKHLIDLGVCHTITYWTDKHHLEGPKYQETGSEYIHEFGEEGGEKPNLVYDTLNERLMIVGGEYVVKDEGIWD